MPITGQHAARQEDPSQFESFRRVHEDGLPEGIDFIYGITSEGKSEVQSIRFDSGKWSESEAKKWLADHDFSSSQFEPDPEEKSCGPLMDGALNGRLFKTLFPPDEE